MKASDNVKPFVINNIKLRRIEMIMMDQASNEVDEIKFNAVRSWRREGKLVRSTEVGGISVGSVKNQTTLLEQT